MFEKFSYKLQKHYKKVIAVWILLVVLAAPALFYTGVMAPIGTATLSAGNAESAIAHSIMKANFKIPESTAIVVVRSENVTSPEVRDFILQLQAKIDDMVRNKQLRYVDSYKSIYTVYSQALALAVLKFSARLHAFYSSVNTTVFALYQIPTIYTNLWLQINGTAFIIYRIPKIYLDNWYKYNQSDAAAYNETFKWLLENNKIYLEFTPDLQDAAFKYLSYFSAGWNASIAFPGKKVEDAISYAVEKLYNHLDRELVTAVYQNFSITNPQDINLNNEIANAIFLSKLAIENGAALYYDIFYKNWQAYFQNLSSRNPYEGCNLISTLTASAYFNQTSAELKTVVETVWEDFNHTDSTDQSRILNFTVASAPQYIKNQTGIEITTELAQMILTQKAFNASSTSDLLRAFQFANAIVKNGTIYTYPIKLIVNLTSVFVSPNNDCTILIVSFTKTVDFTENGKRPIVTNILNLRTAVHDLKVRAQLYEVYVTGDASLFVDSINQVNSDIKKIDFAAIILIFLLCTLFFKSFVPTGVLLALVAFAIIIGIGVILLIALFIVSIQSMLLALLFVITICCGVDYCVLLIARYREERLQHSVEKSVRITLVTAGKSITIAATTMLISFGTLTIFNIRVVQLLGVCVVVAVTIALLAALTLLPACMLLFGDRVFFRGKKTFSIDKKGRKYLAKCAKYSEKYSKVIVLFAIVIVLPAAVFTVTSAKNYDYTEYLPDTESKIGMAKISESFGAGSLTKTYIVVQFKSPIYTNGSFAAEKLDAIDSLCSELLKIEEVSSVDSATRLFDFKINYRALPYLERDAAALYGLIINSSIGLDNKTTVIVATLKSAPFSEKALATIKEIREMLLQRTNANISNIFVGGVSAATIDATAAVTNGFATVIPVILICVFVVLLIVLRKPVISVAALFTAGVSVFITVAITFFVFNVFFGIKLLWLLPYVLFTALIGIGLDYTVFLLTRLDEEMKFKKTLSAALKITILKTAGVITICGVIMAGGFSALLLSPGLLQQFGFALAVGALVDVFLVRSYLLPAFLTVFKKYL